MFGGHVVPSSDRRTPPPGGAPGLSIARERRAWLKQLSRQCAALVQSGYLAESTLRASRNLPHSREEQHSGGASDDAYTDSHAGRKVEDWAEGRA